MAVGAQRDGAVAAVVAAKKALARACGLVDSLGTIAGETVSRHDEASDEVAGTVVSVAGRTVVASVARGVHAASVASVAEIALELQGLLDEMAMRAD